MNKSTVFALAIGAGLASLCIQLISVRPAAAVPAPTKWNHHCFNAGSGGIESKAQALGKQGWEMVGLSSTSGGRQVVCFKRPL